MKFNASKYNSHWQDKKLDELGAFNRGKSKHRPRNDTVLFEGGQYPLVQTGEVKSANLYIDKHLATYNDFGLKQSKLWPKNTLCITIAANIAETAVLKYPMCFPDSIVGFLADKNESSEMFMHYVFTFIRRSIQNSTSGSIQDNINIEYLTGLEFKIPGKAYQDEIVKLLSTLDKKIELNNKINNELEAMMKLIYDYWFVQFDFPDTNGKPYKSSGGKMSYNETLKREIPDDWGVSTFGRCVSVNKGELIIKKNVRKGVVKVVAAGLDYSYFHSTPNYQKNTITVSGSGASAGFVNFWREPIFASDCIAIRGSSDADTLLAFHYLKLIQEHIFRQASGSAQPHVYQDDISGLKYAVAPKKLIEDFGNMTLSSNSKIAINNAESEKLVRLRDWLLPMLMNGQVTVKDSLN